MRRSGWVQGVERLATEVVGRRAAAACLLLAA